MRKIACAVRLRSYAALASIVARTAWTRYVTSTVIVPLASALFVSVGRAQLSPDEALHSFHSEPDLVIELVAAEPLVSSPCALAFDEHGRLYVAENRGYPRSTAPPLGTIAMLEDTDGDGRMDKRTVFADGLTFPNGVLPWKGGVFVTCAPDVFYMKDNDGDGRADERRVILTGFDTTGSTQLRVNTPLLGPDGWIWLASGLSGGNITAPKHPEFPALKLKTDLRFHPETGQFEPVDGRSQFGHSFDNYGRRFICMNRIQVQHVVLPSRYLKRNPAFAFSDTVQNCPDLVPNPLLRGGGGAARIFPLSHNLTTADSHAGTFTAACGVHIWSGGALPLQYDGCAFSCEPTGNLVHVDRLAPSGATFAALPIWKEREFLASRDDWFRPVFLATGPDHALYVADMYRKVIEHPDYLPEEIRKRTDFESGRDMGRIWRIKAKEPPAKLAPSFDSSRFRKLDREGELTDKQLADAFLSDDPGERETALQLAEPRLAKSSSLIDDAIRLAQDPDARVRFQCALTLGSVDEARIAEALSEIAARDLHDRWTRAAILSGVGHRVPEFVDGFLSALRLPPPDAMDFLVECGGLLRDRPPTQVMKELAHVMHGNPDHVADISMAIIVGMTERAGTRLHTAGEDLWSRLVEEATKIATSSAQPVPHRALAIRFLSRTDSAAAEEMVRGIASAEMNEKLRWVAIGALDENSLVKLASVFLARSGWNRLSPQIREAVLNAFLARGKTTAEVLSALESGELPRNAIDATRRQQLLKHKDAALRQRAEKIFASGVDRMTAFENAKAVLALKPNAANGGAIFKRACASCHRLDREGFGVGPDLFGIRNQPKETILLHIVVPEHEIAPGFTAYLVETKDGRTLSGIILSETEESITLRQPLGVEDNILRRDIMSMTQSPLSLMPAGLEQTMSPQEMADLLAYLKGEI
jgi:putative membrane-bound dehydrogenase-like protein